MRLAAYEFRDHSSKGQITIPREIRKHLRLKTGDRVDFFLDFQVRVTVEVKRVPFEQLFGLLHKPGRKPVTVRAMDRGIAKAVRDDWKRGTKSRRS